MLELLADLNKVRPLISRQDKWKFIVLLILMLLGAMFEAASIAAIPAFVSIVTNPSSLSDNPWVGAWLPVLPDQPTVELVLWAAVMLFVFILVKNVFLSAIIYFQARLVTTQRLKLGDRLFRAYQSAPYEWHIQRSSSEFLRNIQEDTSKILVGVVMPFLTLIRGAVMATVIIGLMVLSMPGPVFLSLLVIGFGLFVVIRAVHKRLRHIGEVNRNQVKEMFKAIQQGFGALIDSKIIGCEKYLSEVHKSSLAQITRAQRQQMTIQKSTPYALETIVILGFLVVLLTLVRAADSLNAAVPMIVLLGVATLRLKQLATQVAGAINQMNSARAHIPGISEDLHTLDSIEAKRARLSSNEEDLGSFDSLQLRGVTYAYPNCQDNALKEISLELRRGESIAFVGSTGSGKSTIVNLLLGLLEPQAGHVRVNGNDVYQNMSSWRRHLGYIPQSIFLIDDSIRANIAFGVYEKDIDNARIKAAIKTAMLTDFVESLPNGLDTIVGERGVRLSGGQRQRLGIARALYPNPSVLVMDEATSALDNKTESMIMDAIANLKKDRTLIMVAHRLSTVKDCDRLYYLREGEIEKSGTYAELIEGSPSFREMVKAGLGG